MGAAARTASLWCACRACSQRRSRAQRAQVARIAPRSWVHVATSWRLIPVATSNWCRDTAQSTPGRDLRNGVATPTTTMQPEPCRDMKTKSRPSWRLPYVATSNSCRDIVSAHSGLSRSRHRNPCRDLPHCHPCRDIKSMSRRRFLLTKADQVATPLPGHDLTPNQTQSFPQPSHDTKRMSRHQLLQSSFCLAQIIFFFKLLQ